MAMTEQMLIKRWRSLESDLKAFHADPALMALCHPTRCQAMPLSDADVALASIFGVRHADWARRQIMSRLASGEIAMDLAEKDGVFHESIVEMRRGGAGSGGGAVNGLTQALRYRMAGGACFTLDDDLVDLLHLTDLDLDVPMSEVKLPFNDVYLEFGRSRERSIPEFALMNPASGLHAFEGMYLSNVVSKSGQAMIEVNMTGSALGKRHIADDAMEWVCLQVGEGMSVRQSLDASFDVLTHGRSVSEADRQIVQRLQDEAKQKFGGVMAKRLEMGLKALLYLNMRECRRELRKDRTEAAKVVARTVSGAHRRKAVAKMMQCQDTILILGPEEDGENGASPCEGNQGVAVTTGVHWRRGHIRMARVGVGRCETRAVLIRPVLVNAHRLGSMAPAPAPKQYQAY